MTGLHAASREHAGGDATAKFSGGSENSSDARNALQSEATASRAPMKITDLRGKVCANQPGPDDIPTLLPGKSKGCFLKAASTADGGVDKNGHLELNTKAIYEKGLQSGVHIKMSGYENGRLGNGNGSGVIIGRHDNQLLIATDNHLFTSESGKDTRLTSLKAEMPDGHKYNARIVLRDPKHDRAVIAVNAGEHAKDYKVATVAEDLNSRGHGAVFGWPRLSKSPYLSPGELRGTKSLVELTGGEHLRGEDLNRKLIVINARTEGGNSGGAAYNSKGEVIGLLTGGADNKSSTVTPLRRAEVDAWLKKIERKL